MEMTVPPEGQNSILVVDDNPTNLDVMFNYLDEAGFEVFVAEDGPDALQRAETVQPDLILLDILMPQMDGLETCRQLKQNAETDHIPVIFVTALTDVENKLKGFEAGGIDYITKPFHYQEVMARITTHLTLCNTQAALQEHVQTLRQRNQELDAFSYTVAHNLKNSLQVLINCTQLVVEEPELPASSRRYLDIALETAIKMTHVIKELQLLGNVRKAEIEPEPLEMKQLVLEALKRLQTLLEKYNPRIELQEEWPAGLGYAPWLEEVWLNYLSNGLKYGGDPPLLSVGATPQADGQIRCWVKDRGPGLTPEDQAKLFVQFTRLGQKDSQGYGLGLYIVRRIMEKLGGQYGVESEPGQGSTFYFTVPGV